MKRLFPLILTAVSVILLSVCCRKMGIVISLKPEESISLKIEKEVSAVPLDYSINLTKTDIIATSGDNILKIVGNDLIMSNDLGKTWKSLENSIGIISFVHWFKDQSCLICGRNKAYWVDKSFSEIQESIVYDYDGSILNDSSPHFYTSLHGHSDYEEIAGKEALVWSDYFGDVDGYISRLWYTDDCGRTLFCICKNRETLTKDGELINCRHFHDCTIREKFDEIYITSGDNGEQCELIKGELINGRWSYSIIGKGSFYKFDSISISEPYLYLLCDYTGYGQTGILRVRISESCYRDKYEYILTCNDNLPILRQYSIGKYAFIIYDGSVKGKLLLSYDSSPYQVLSVSFDNYISSVSYLSNPNNAGLVLMRKGDGYNINDLKLNDCMYNLTDAMHEAGRNDFGL